MRTQTAWRWLLGWVMALGVILTFWLADPTSAQSIQKLQQQQKQIQQELNSTRQRIDALQQHENAARQRIGNLQDSIEVTNTRLEDTQYRLQQAQKAVAQAQEKLNDLEAKLKRQQTGTAARLRYLQRQGAEHWWALLLSSEDLNQFFDRRHQLQLLVESDRALIAQLQKTAQEVEQQRIALEAQKNEIALIMQELAVQKNQLQEDVVAQQQLVGRLSSQRAAFEAAQKRLETDSQQLSGLIQRLIAEQAAREKQKGAPVVRGTGRMQAPVSGPITSGFGYRVHPVYGSRRFHAGIDFGVPTGTSVRAADRGTVIYAGWFGGYGNTVIINHGGGISSLYAHNSRVYVGPGQVVQRGQAVAGSGSTGLSTGPHVHFEVRVNGQPVDPRRYF